MESKTIIICVLVVVFGITSFIACFAAQATKVKKSQAVVVYYYLKPKCEYPSSTLSIGLAIAATLALEIARGIISATTGGYCSCFRTIANLPEIARISYVISWIMSTVADILFIWGIRLSGKERMEITADSEYYCYTLRPNIFSGASVMALVSVLLSLTYYLFYVAAQKGGNQDIRDRART